MASMPAIPLSDFAIGSMGRERVWANGGFRRRAADEGGESATDGGSCEGGIGDAQSKPAGRCSFRYLV